MIERELKRLSRRDLLEMLLEQSRQMDALKKENERLREELDSRRIMVGCAGSIAEASLRLSGVFEAAQKAADLYLENVKAEFSSPKETNDAPAENYERRPETPDITETDGAPTENKEPRPEKTED